MKADILFVTSKRSLFQKAVAWFTDAKAVHVAGELDNAGVIEALLTVKTTPMKKWLDKHTKYEIWRNTRWTDSEKQAVCDEMKKFEGNPYGFPKLIAIALDMTIAKVWKEKFIFRKLLFSKQWPICSWVYAYGAYDALGYEFGTEPEYADPESMRQHCKESSDWKLMTARVK